jgi:hypothetical protein
LVIIQCHLNCGWTSCVGIIIIIIIIIIGLVYHSQLQGAVKQQLDSILARIFLFTFVQTFPRAQYRPAHIREMGCLGSLSGSNGCSKKLTAHLHIVKVTFPLEHATKAQKGSRCTAVLFP